MQKHTPNSFGLYDAPNRSEDLPITTLSEENLQKQLDDGAFLLTREEAIATGFLSPFDEQDVARTDIGG